LVVPLVSSYEPGGATRLLAGSATSGLEEVLRCGAVAEGMGDVAGPGEFAVSLARATPPAPQPEEVRKIRGIRSRVSGVG